MPSRAKPLILLQCLIVCASSAPLQETFRNCWCFLPCDGAPELKRHDSVHVFVQHLSEKHEQIYNVSSLYDGGRCAVPGCFQRHKQYTLKIYANNDPVPKILVDKTDLQPDCDPEGISGKNPNSAAGNLSNKLLILLAFCFRFIIHFEEPR